MTLKQEMARGVFWIAVAKYSGIVLQLFITAILARLITPAAFGTIAVALVIMSFLNIIVDIGIGPAVVQYKALTKNHLDSLFTLNIYIGIFLACILFFLSGVISSYYGDVVLKRVCQLMTLVIFFNSLNVVPNALMRKDKRFRTIAIRTLFFQICSGVIAVWGAFHGWGIYALLVSPILTAIGVFCVNYYNYPLRPVVSMNKEAIILVSSFSFFQFAFNFFNYFSRNLDKLIIGRYYSLSQLGYYDKSYQLMLVPLHNITYVFEPVLHPILSSLQDNRHELGLKNCKLASLISKISFPIGLYLYFSGGEVIRFVFGNQWGPAIPVFKVLALSLPLQMIQSTSGAIYQAAGKTNHMFYNGILNTTVTITGFLMSVLFGGTIEAMAWAFVLTLYINFIDSYLILYYFTIKESALDFFKSLLPQLINSICVFLIMLVFSYIIREGNILVGICWKFVGVALFTCVMAIFLRQYNFWDILKGMKYFKRF